MLELLKNYASKGEVVIVAGSGISKESPSNVPSWWEYNMMLLKVMGKCAAETLAIDESLLSEERLNCLPVTAISEFIVDRFAGDSYYPLISMLEATVPNKNHFMLAELLKRKIIRGCITTNFDTLIEHACKELGLSVYVMEQPDEYLFDLNSLKHNQFPILKIHGSVSNTQYAIDTVRQKSVGLDEMKRAQIELLFNQNHILFLGFSGEDFQFGREYLPLSACKKGITWIAFPESTINDRIQEFCDKEDFELAFLTLPDFFYELNWELSSSSNEIMTRFYSTISDNSDSSRIDEKQIYNHYINNSQRWGCVGACLQLLDIQDNPLADCIIDSVFDRVPSIDYIQEGDLAKLPAYTAATVHCLKKGDVERAELWVALEELILERCRDSILSTQSAKHIRNYCFNYATVLQNGGRVQFQRQQYANSLNYYKRSLYYAYKGHAFQALSSALLGIVECKGALYSASEYTLKELFSELHAARNIAINGGFVDARAFVDYTLVKNYLNVKDYRKAQIYYKDIIEVANICTQPDAINAIIKELKKLLSQICTEENYEFTLTEPYTKASEYAWYPFTFLPILKYEAGIKCKEILEIDGIIAACHYLEGICAPYLDNRRIKEACHDLEKVVSLLDCYAALLQECCIDDKDYERINSNLIIRNIYNYLLEYNLHFLDYTAMRFALSGVAWFYATTAIEEEEYQIAEFASKCCIAMFPPGGIDNNYILSIAALYLLSIKKDNKIEAKKYAEEFLGLPEKETEDTIPKLRDNMEQFLKNR